MALGKSAIFSALSGKLTGTEAAMTKQGMVLKKNRPSKTMNSPAEIAARRTFKEWAKRWSTLSADQVQAFNAYAATHPVTDRLGSSKYISGRNWFMKLRMPISDEYDAFAETMPPAESTMPIWFAPGDFWFNGPYDITFFTHEPAKEDVVISLWVARWQSSTITHKPQTWIPVPPVKYWPLTYDWYDIFSAAGIEFQAGEHIAVKAVCRMPDKWPSTPFILWRTVQPWMTAWYKCNDDWPSSEVTDEKDELPGVQYSNAIEDDTSNHTVAGHIGTALYQDGTDDMIKLPEDAYVPILAESQNFTISFWWKADSPAPETAKHFLSNYDSAGVGIAWLTRFDTYRTVIRAKKGATTVEDLHTWTKAVDAAWHFFAITRDGTHIIEYLDDDETHEINAANYDGAIAEASHILSVGALMGISHWAPGAIDDLRIYPRCLRPDEIAVLGAM